MPRRHPRTHTSVVQHARSILPVATLTESVTRELYEEIGGGRVEDLRVLDMTAGYRMRVEDLRVLGTTAGYRMRVAVLVEGTVTDLPSPRAPGAAGEAHGVDLAGVTGPTAPG